MTEAQRDYRHIWERIHWVLAERYEEDRLPRLSEEVSFYIFRPDTNAILARGILGFDAAKEKANQIRKAQGLKWDQVKFRAERNNRPNNQFGVSRDGRTFTNAYGQRGRMDYSPRVNPSKGRRFRGYYGPDGSWHDLD